MASVTGSNININVTWHESSNMYHGKTQAISINGNGSAIPTWWVARCIVTESGGEKSGLMYVGNVSCNDDVL